MASRFQGDTEADIKAARSLHHHSIFNNSETQRTKRQFGIFISESSNSLRESVRCSDKE
jgi:hypothetical protein